MKKLLLFAFALVSILKSNAQSSCATDEVDAYLRRTNPTYVAERQKMEQEIYTIIKNKQNNQTARISQNDCQPNGVFTIPIVVHVMHIGEPVGTGINISDAQIQGAIQGLNERWRRITGDGVDLEIQFALAVRDPNGNVSTGINRVNSSSVPRYVSQGLHAGDTLGADDIQLKSLSIWPKESYINIWITKLTGACGYANYPSNYQYEGVVMDYQCMSYSSVTLAHEMGHSFDLIHTFGGDGSGSGVNPSTQCPLNNDCLFDGDKVCDTPTHRKEECASTNCVSIGDIQNSFSNYMSYCSGIRFTNGQKERVRAALYGDFTWSLVISDGLVPVSTPLEVGLVSLENNFDEPVCNSTTIKLKIKNSGTTKIDSIKISSYVDGNLISTNKTTIAILKDSSMILPLSILNNISTGIHTISFSIVKINNSTTDFYNLNNQLCKTILVRGSLNNNNCFDFENGINVMNSLKPRYIADTVNTNIYNLSSCSSLHGNKCLKIPFWNKAGNTFKECNFYLYNIDLDSIFDAYVTFDYSFVKSKVGLDMRMSMYLTDGCDSTSKYTGYTSDVNFNAIGTDSINAWSPTNCSNWKSDTAYLYNGLFGNKNSLLKVNISGSGTNISSVGKYLQNLYLDNFCIHRRCEIKPFADGNAGSVIGWSIYDEGQTVSVTAYPDQCHTFKNWTENGVVVSTSANYTFITRKNRYLKANFNIKNVSLTLSSQPSNAGITIGNGIFVCDTTIMIKAKSNSEYKFKYWYDGLNIVSSDSIFSFHLDANTNLTAIFERFLFDINVSINPTFGGYVTGGGLYEIDSIAHLKAIPNIGYVFLNWTDGSNIVSTNANYNLLVDGEHYITANFGLATNIKQSTINKIAKLFPNPANDILQVEIQSKQYSCIALNIIDMKGSLLETKTLTNTKGTLNTSFDVSKLAKGNYLLNLYDEEGMASYKFIVQ